MGVLPQTVLPFASVKVLMLLGFGVATACRPAETPVRAVTLPPDAALARLPPTFETASRTLGLALPLGAVEARVEDETLLVGGLRWSPRDGLGSLRRRVGERPLVLSWQQGEFLAQVAPALAVLDDAGMRVWLVHPRATVGYPLELFDAGAFQTWLDAPTPGRVRVIQRTDGLEIQTSVGKLPGPDPNGPSLPQQNGRVDVAGLRHALARLQSRFGAVDGICLVPSFGMELDAVTDALSGMFADTGQPFFEPLRLVYPRPASVTRGANP